MSEKKEKKKSKGGRREGARVRSGVRNQNVPEKD